MDQYTSDTQKWLDTRYRLATDDGFFFAHQNIYGFQSRFLLTSMEGRPTAYAEPGAVSRYVIFWNIIQALKMLQFDSVLDVGGAEGYMSGAFRAFFGARVRSCDLSGEACKRAKEIFDVDADTVDGVSLPYPDGAFDVVICSESMEHIPQYEHVLNELLRVAKKSVIITVPHDGPEAVARNIREKTPHGHIHDFTLDSFDKLVPAPYKVKAIGLNSSLNKLPFRLIEGAALDPASRPGIKAPFVKLLNKLIPFTRSFMDQAAFKFFLRLDPFFANTFKTYRGVLYIISKDPSAFTSTPHHANVDMDTVLNFKVPLHPMAEQ
jgi:SAM-dependent methyltransferase